MNRPQIHSIKIFAAFYFFAAADADTDADADADATNSSEIFLYLDPVNKLSDLFFAKLMAL